MQTPTKAGNPQKGKNSQENPKGVLSAILGQFGPLALKLERNDRFGKIENIGQMGGLLVLPNKIREGAVPFPSQLRLFVAKLPQKIISYRRLRGDNPWPIG